MEVQTLKTKRLLISLKVHKKHPAQCFVRITKAIKDYNQDSLLLSRIPHAL